MSAVEIEPTPPQITFPGEQALVEQFGLPDVIISAVGVRLNAARAVIGLINGQNTQADISRSLAELGHYKNTRSAEASLSLLMDVINEASLTHTGSSLIVRELRGMGCSPNPALYEEFTSLRERLLPTAGEVDPTALMSPIFAETYFLQRNDKSGRWQQFANIAARANAKLSVPVERRMIRQKDKYEIEEPLPPTSMAAAVENVLSLPLEKAINGVYPATALEVRTAKHELSVTQIKSAESAMREWLNVELFSYNTTRNGDQGRLAGVNAYALDRIRTRLAENRELQASPQIKPADRTNFWAVSNAVSRFISWDSPHNPLPGTMPLKAALCVYSSLELLQERPDLPAKYWQRANILKETYGRYLKFFGILPEQVKLPRKDMLSGGRKEIVIKDLSKGACLSAGVDLFFSEDEADIKQAEAKCDRCPVRKPCLEEALANKEQDGVWGLSVKHRKALVRRENRLKQKQAIIAADGPAE